MNTLLSIVLLVVVLIKANGSSNLTGITVDLPDGACLCFSDNDVIVSSTPCGKVLGAADAGQCFRYKGRKEACVYLGIGYEFLLFDYNGLDGWSAADYINGASNSFCHVNSGRCPCSTGALHNCTANQIANSNRSVGLPQVDLNHNDGNANRIEVANDACLCFSATGVNVRATPCGTVLGSTYAGQCFQSKGRKQACTLAGVNYEFFLFDFFGQDGWSAGDYINMNSNGLCSASVAQDGYLCEVANQGQRIHEDSKPTQYDCRDTGCGDTCRGGQHAAYVKCRCTRNGKFPPDTPCWRAGTKLKTADGICNRAIPVNTAIATFDQNGHYYAGHAAVFMGCQDDYNITTYDQGCCRSIGHFSYLSNHPYFDTFAVITNLEHCKEKTSYQCRAEDAGNTCCPKSVPGCNVTTLLTLSTSHNRSNQPTNQNKPVHGWKRYMSTDQKQKL